MNWDEHVNRISRLVEELRQGSDSGVADNVARLRQAIVDARGWLSENDGARGSDLVRQCADEAKRVSDRWASRVGDNGAGSNGSGMTWREHVNRIDRLVEELRQGTGWRPGHPGAARLRHAIADAHKWMSENEGARGYDLVFQRANKAMRALSRWTSGAGNNGGADGVFRGPPRESSSLGSALIGLAGVAVVGGIIYVVLAD